MGASQTRCFWKNNWIVDCDTLLTYMNFCETFKINIDARAFQLGAIISQKGKSIGFYSRKITGVQKGI